MKSQNYIWVVEYKSPNGLFPGKWQPCTFKFEHYNIECVFIKRKWAREALKTLNQHKKIDASIIYRITKYVREENIILYNPYVEMSKRMRGKKYMKA